VDWFGEPGVIVVMIGEFVEDIFDASMEWLYDLVTNPLPLRNLLSSPEFTESGLLFRRSDFL
jgi:hypothetical protein